MDQLSVWATSLSRPVHWLAILANVVGTLVVLLLVVVIAVDVVGRGAFHAPFLGAVEIVQFSMVLIVFLQLPDVVRAGRLTRSDGFLGILAGRHPAWALALQRFIDLSACALMAMIAYAYWPEFIEMWETQDFFGIPGVFTAPWWPIKLAIFFSGFLCALIFLLRAVTGVRQPAITRPIDPTDAVS